MTYSTQKAIIQWMSHMIKNCKSYNLEKAIISVFFPTQKCYTIYKIKLKDIQVHKVYEISY
jgi:hypothetical protein